ncbi:hypothetical protein L2E82_48442 [Cichorium intybus]|uniref:Uncharacterized protein n=1 Tax=Cichorium intybus TaxID=13427 RepID=A0ACB8YYP9_CICIN|nr:hypothetical protein L2E82_48442 [Cichorium intybus]
MTLVDSIRWETPPGRRAGRECEQRSRSTPGTGHRISFGSRQWIIGSLAAERFTQGFSNRLGFRPFVPC